MIMSSTTSDNNEDVTTTTTTTFHIVGDAFVDLFCFLDGDWPEHGGDSILGQPVKSYAGGSSTNTATHLKSLIKNFGKVDNNKSNNNNNNNSEEEEAEEVLLHTVLNPNDHYGQLLLEHSQQHQFPIINCRRQQNNNESDNNISYNNDSTGHCIAIVDRTGGERSFMTHPGCVGQFHADDIQISQIIHTPSNIHLHIAGFYNIPGFWDGKLQTQLQTIRSERTKLFGSHFNTTISLVTQHDATKLWDGGLDTILPLLDFAIMNDLEANHICNKGFDRLHEKKQRQHQKQQHEEDNTTSGSINNDNDDEMSQKLWASYFNIISSTTNIIVTRGEDGAIAIRNGQVIANQAAKVVKPIDPTGAGDSFTAGYIHGIWSWKQQQQEQQTNDNNNNNNNVPKEEDIWPIEAIQEGLRWGCAVGRAAVLIRGASVPSPPNEILKFWPNGT